MLGGSGDLVCRLLTGLPGVVTWLMGVFGLLAKFP